VIDPHALINEFGLDQTRYFLMREVPFGNDGNFSRDRMITVINSELANTIGNLCQRTLGFINKNCGGVVPTPQDLSKIIGEQGNDVFYDCLSKCHFNSALTLINAKAQNANLYIDSVAPWKLKKENPELMDVALYNLVERIRQIAILLQPFMPQSAAKMLVLVGYSEEVANKGVPFSELDKPLKSGTPLPAPTPVFPRFVEA
jgi:methionyl-tRNA synthetase